MKKRYFDDPNENVAFERCINVLAELIEKYAGSFALCDVRYEYWGVLSETPLVTAPFSFEDYAKRCSRYDKHFRIKQKVKYNTAKNQIDIKSV